MVKIAINGFGRIGRTAFRAAMQRRDLQVVAVNDLLELPHLAYLLKHDSVHGPFGGEVALGHLHGRPLEVHLHLEGFRVNADEQLSFLHGVVVVHEDVEHLAGHARGDEGDVAIDVRVVGGNRVERGHHPGNQEVGGSREDNECTRGQEEALAPAVRRLSVPYRAA